jgi:hypothetical protein
VEIEHSAVGINAGKLPQVSDGRETGSLSKRAKRRGSEDTQVLALPSRDRGRSCEIESRQ